MWKSFVLGLIIGISPAAATAADVDACARELIKAHREGAALPVLSVSHSGIDRDQAYAIQKAYVARRLAHDTVAGFKAGVTSKAAQASLGMDRPAAGVLFQSGARSGGAIIGKSGFGGLFLETEIGFVVSETISGPIETIAQLRKHIKAIVPVIELPDISFKDRSTLKGVDLIAANVASTQFIVGTPKVVDFDVNAVLVSLARDGEELSSGRGSDAMGGQWVALLWLVNHTILQGHTIRAGHVLITGSLGKLVPGEPGHHVADFGALGKIHFDVR